MMPGERLPSLFGAFPNVSPWASSSIAQIGAYVALGDPDPSSESSRVEARSQFQVANQNSLNVPIL